MLSHTSEIEGRLQRLKGRETRTQSIRGLPAVKKERYCGLPQAAERTSANGRGSLVGCHERTAKRSDGAALFAEVQALRLLLINTLELLLAKR